MSEAIQWIHDDLLQVTSDLPAVYVFDEEKLRSEGWSLKRIGFIYECLLELPVTIRKGDPVAEVAQFAHNHGANTIRVARTPDPRLQSQARQLAEQFKIDQWEPACFVNLSGPVDLKRFSRYWQKASRALGLDPSPSRLRHDGAFSESQPSGKAK